MTPPLPPAAPRHGFADIARLYLLLAATLVALGLILRVIAPALVSRHDDLSLVLAVVLVLACPLGLIWAGRLALRLWRTPRRAAS